MLTNPIVPMIFSTFLREHPKAQIYLNEGSMNKHVEMVTGEMLDLAYNAFPTAPEAEELEIIPMGTMEIHAVLHPDHPWRGWTGSPGAAGGGEAHYDGRPIQGEGVDEPGV